MRVLFTSIEGNHFHQMVPLAWALRTAGHEVLAACNEQLVDTVTQTGLTAVPIQSPTLWEQLDDFQKEAISLFNEIGTRKQDPSKVTWEDHLSYENMVVPALYQPLNNDAQIDQLVEVARGWRPDLVLWESFSIAGAVVAVATGAAHARLVSGPELALQMVTRGHFVRHRDQQPEPLREDPTAEWLDWTLERLGSDRRFDETMLTGQWVVDTRPGSLRQELDLPTVPMRYVPYNGRCAVPRWLHEPAERRRVCVTLGTSITSEESERFRLGDTLAALFGSLAGLDVEIIAALDPAQRDALPELPDNIRTTDFVPLNELAPSCSVIVHHAGYQTKATADLHGVPQVVIVGYEWVSEDMGEEYEKSGTTLAVSARDLTADVLRERILRLLDDPSYTERAGDLREEIRAMPTPNEVVPVLERLTREHRHGV
ncbi:activator-dependent family glycosyltransferase [Streptomyces sp. WMMC940]|uniref:activator-dependent family glycosyltransferase n=1 Tax=Streptomyces sp. WMMC940 TaxID=3015153 RepID=UPI0022B63E65|nr:activator-dependent family glycosyltransferase [Streptomyces sp. WMMC940]MCZ7457446.1 activator-dependent family glycosyltransferase [Streptomyces sp. WMMC940]